MPWVYSPHTGGKTIPAAVRERTRQRILAHAQKHYRGRYTRLDVRFHGALCYIDAFVEPQLPKHFPPKGWHETREEALARMRETPTHLVRLRYFGDEERWTLSFFTYSNEKYEPCFFQNGDDHGTPEEALDVGAVYLQE